MGQLRGFLKKLIMACYPRVVFELSGTSEMEFLRKLTGRSREQFLQKDLSYTPS